MTREQKVEKFCNRVRELKDPMYRLSMSILGNEADAEDAIQRALLNGYEKLDQLRMFTNLKPWMMKILTNECYKIIGDRRTDADISQLSDLLVHQEKGVAVEARVTLWDCILKLDEVYREPIILFYYDDMPNGEIAEILGLTEETVRKRISRGREKLKGILEKEAYYG